MKLQFVVPGPIHGKGAPRAVRRGRFLTVHTDEKTEQYENRVAIAAQAAMGGRSLIEGPVALQLDIRCAVPASWSGIKQRMALAGEIMPTTKPDCSNVVKSIEDGCNGVVWRDDTQVVRHGIEKRYAAVPGVVVTIELLARIEPVQQEIELDEPPQPAAQASAADEVAEAF